jgi:hypothetical protein
MREGEMTVIPDDNPKSGMHMTIREIRDILTNDYGADTGNRMPPNEVDQVIAALKDGHTVELCEAQMYLQPAEEAPGLYCAYEKKAGY